MKHERKVKQMVEVRIRSEYDESAVKLGEVEFIESALDRVIPLLSAWGVADQEGNVHDLHGFDGGGMVGQFKLIEGAAYFEVILVSSGD